MAFSTMIFFKNRRRRKYLAELRACRHAEDDRISDADRRDFDDLLNQLAAAKPEESVAAVAAAQEKFARLELASRYGTLRNWLDLLAVVGAVAFGVRGLFFQPFRIPTSSMQPTLYGIHYICADAGKIAATPAGLRQLLFSARDARLKISAPGRLDIDSIAENSGVFTDDTAFAIGGKKYTLPGTLRKVSEYADLDPEREYAAGDTIANGFLVLGDHLFVERLSLYLRPPERGDVMVFNTGDLYYDGQPLEQRSGYYYIKRLAALPGDTIRLSRNQFYVRPRGAEKFSRIQDIAPRFKKVYSQLGGYQGHWSGMGGFLPGDDVEYTLPEDSYFMLGDNSAFSLDSRFFGPVPHRNLVGRAWAVFWPFGRRWGWIDRAEPVREATGEPHNGTFPVMFKQ